MTKLTKNLYQPSGHINISRSREFYLKYVSDPSVINSTTRGILIIVASAINFLLISDGSKPKTAEPTGKCGIVRFHNIALKLSSITF